MNESSATAISANDNGNGNGNDRFSRQRRFPGIGTAGQERLAASSVLVIGGGALGAAAVEGLVRAGIGHVSVVDRDLVEAHNLHRQGMFDAADAAAAHPKAAALAAQAKRIDPACSVTAIVSEAHAGNLATLIADHDLIIDGTDNFRTRHQINDTCFQLGKPWIYGGCIAAQSMAAAFIPQANTGCFRCLQGDEPEAGTVDNCQTAGIILPAVWQTAAWQLTLAMKILTKQHIQPELLSGDIWQGTEHRLSLHNLADDNCPTCGKNRTFPALTQQPQPATVMCGRQAVQVNRSVEVNLKQLATIVPQAIANDWLVRWPDHFQGNNVTVTAFADGRVLVQGVDTAIAAQTIVDRWFG